MKNTNFLFALLFALFACQSEKQTSDASKEEVLVEVPEENIVEPEPAIEDAEGEVTIENLPGYYVGYFRAVDFKEGGTGSNKITISIDSVKPPQIWGKSIVAGNFRPFEGIIEPETFSVAVKEPGDDRYDGEFSFIVRLDGKIEGKWYAYDKTLKVTQRKYELEKRAFSYDKNQDLPDLEYHVLYDASYWNNDGGEGEILTSAVTTLNPSNTILKKEDVENMYKGDLEVIRNSIYARHGYSFKNRKMRYVFDHIDWYMPVSTDIRMDLTALEMQNIELLKRYEEHAEAYYDSFGR